MINSGTFWRCRHGSTGFKAGLELEGCEQCAADNPEAFSRFHEAEPKPTTNNFMSTEQLLSKIAHYEMACGIDKDVPGMSGFLVTYLRSQPKADAALMLRYEKIRSRARGDLADMMEKSADSKAPDSQSPGDQR